MELRHQISLLTLEFYKAILNLKLYVMEEEMNAKS